MRKSEKERRTSVWPQGRNGTEKYLLGFLKKKKKDEIIIEEFPAYDRER